MPADSFHRTFDAALKASRRDEKPAVYTTCKVGHVSGDPSSMGHTSVRCDTCGSRSAMNPMALARLTPIGQSCKDFSIPAEHT